MLLLLPAGPQKVAIGCETLLRAVLPPVALLKDRLYDGEVVPVADPELLCLVYLALVGALGPCRHRRIATHVRLDNALGQPVGRKDGFMQQILHFYLDVEDELAAVEEFAKGGF